MNSIIDNPYRIAGILSNASAREIHSRKGKITAYSKVGKEINSEYDFPFLPPIHRNETIIDKAFSAIEQNQNKVTHSLFWFINLNSIDDTAIQHLINGNKEKAIEIWKKLIDEKEVTAKNFSSLSNIGTLYLLDNSKEKIKQGITTKIKLIESENFKDFVHTIADETFSIDNEKQIEILIDELLMQFKNKFSITETMELFSNCKETTQKYLSKKFTEEPIHRIETKIEQCTKKRIRDKINAYTFANDLYSSTKSELTLLKSILGQENLQYKMLADNISKELLQCSIDYFNESLEQEKCNNYIEEATTLIKLAESIAISDTVKSKIEENIKALKEMKDRELNHAIEVLKSIKKAYHNACSEIRKEFNIYDYQVEQKARNLINKKIAIELVDEALSEKNLINISKSNLTDKIKELYDLIIYIDLYIVSIALDKKEEILHNSLPKSNEIYKLLDEKKERKRIADLEYQKRQEEENVSYKNVIEQADVAFKNKKWKIAIEKYEEAQKIKRYERYPEEKIDEIKKIQKDKKDNLTSYGCLLVIIAILVGGCFLFGWWFLFFIFLIVMSAFGKK